MDFIGELWSMNECFIFIHLLVLKTTQFYQLKDLLFSVDWSFIVEKNIWAMESCGGFVLCPGREKIILAKSRTRNRGRKVNGRKVFKVNDVIILLARCSGLQAWLAKYPIEKETREKTCQDLVSFVTNYFLFSGTANISEEHLNHARKWGTPVDCTWIIRAEVRQALIGQYKITWL